MRWVIIQGMIKALFKALLGIFCTLALAVLFLGAGVALCAYVPTVTGILSSLTSAFDSSPYTHDDLHDLAMEARAFTVEDYHRAEGGVEAAASAFAHAVMEAAADSSSPASGKSDAFSDEAREVISNPQADELEWMYELANVDQRYALDADAIDHLEDVHAFLMDITRFLVALAAAALITLIISGAVFKRRFLGGIFMAAGFVTILLFAAAAAWASIDFLDMFNFMHSFFFSQGTWQFPADSLLISMYPTAFWMGMCGVAVGFATVLSIIFILVGWRLRRHLS